MKYHILTIASALALTLCFMPAAAQVTSSPYTRLGYGFVRDNATGTQRAMGGVGYAMTGGRNINVMNPASYAGIDSLTFIWDIGLDATHCWSKEGDKNAYSLGGGLDYLSGEFRVTKGLGAAFGLVPYSNVGYSFGNTLDNGSETRSGSGGLSELFVGAGYMPFKGFSIGANVSFLFGTTTHTTSILGTSTTIFQRTAEVRDWRVKLGAQYTLPLGKNDKLTLGFVFSPKKSFHGHVWGIHYDAVQDIEVDTVGYASMNGRYEQPNSFGGGIAFNHANRFTAEIDFTYQDWSKTKYEAIDGFEATGVKWDNRWKVAAGMSYTPNPRGSYVNRMTYRIGAFYNHDYMNVNGNNVRDYGITAGVSFPALGSKTLVNVGLEWKRRDSAPTSLIRENYLGMMLSVNFNEMWFWKNKIR